RGPRISADEPSPRDLAPCLYAAGRLYVAPADYDQLLCLDAATGRTLWELGPLEVVHLLGVGQGRLIFTTPQGLRAVDAATGSDRGGWQQPSDGTPLGPFGRGLLVGDLVLWPTKLGLRVVRQTDGERPEDLNPSWLDQVPPGNLAFGDGCLAVAGTEVLSIYL